MRPAGVGGITKVFQLLLVDGLRIAPFQLAQRCAGSCRHGKYVEASLGLGRFGFGPRRGLFHNYVCIRSAETERTDPRTPGSVASLPLFTRHRDFDWNS